MGLIMGVIIGGVSGWTAGKIMNSNLSLPGNIGLGILGGFVGNILLGILGIHGSGLVGNIIVSVVGACVVIAIGRSIKH